MTGAPRWWACAAALALLGAIHFAFVLLSILPLNPLGHRLAQCTNAWVVPVFAQNWQLFAPDPISADFAAHARGWSGTGERENPSEWVAVSEPLLAALRANRLTPLNLSLTVLSKAMSSVYTETGLATADAETRARLLEEWRQPAQRPRGLVTLESAGAAALQAAFPQRHFERIQIVLRVRPVPRFSARELEPQESAARADEDVVLFRPSEMPRATAWVSR